MNRKVGRLSRVLILQGSSQSIEELLTAHSSSRVE